MEREREKAKEITKEVKEITKEAKERELDLLRKELERLRELKRQKELKEQEENRKHKITLEKEEKEYKAEETSRLDNIELRLNEIDKFLQEQLGKINESTYKQRSNYIESQLQVLEEEIIGEKGIIQKELSSYEKLLREHPWIEEPKYEFMYDIPNKKKNQADYNSWRIEWAKVLFDYAKYAILHILYLRQLHSEKPFSNFQDRQKAIKEIADELVNQNLAIYISKERDKLRVYWKTIELWAEALYNWALNNGKLGPILIYEIRESKEEFSNLPRADLEEIFKLLSKDNRGNIIKLDDGDIAFKIKEE